MPIKEQSVSHILSSPPYCTRIDYAVATALELGLLGYTRTEFNSLRLSLLGSPLTNGEGFLHGHGVG